MSTHNCKTCTKIYFWLGFQNIRKVKIAYHKQIFSIKEL